MDGEAAFRRRLRKLVEEKYGSVDRFYLETDFSKGHLSNILRGKRNPSVSTLVKLAKLLEVEVRDLFVFPERGVRDQVFDQLRNAAPEVLRRVMRILSSGPEK
jgi:transcriptional regulator with XRE-family HTH domain